MGRNLDIQHRIGTSPMEAMHPKITNSRGNLRNWILINVIDSNKSMFLGWKQWIGCFRRLDVTFIKSLLYQMQVGGFRVKIMC